MKKYLKLVVVLPLLLISIIAFAHPGRTDANGGHYNHSTGEYHYHDGNSAGKNTGLNIKTETDYSDVIKEYNEKKSTASQKNLEEKNAELTKEIKQLKTKNNTLNNQIEILSKIGTALICFSSIVLSIILYKIIIILPENIKNIIGFLSAFLVWFCVVFWFWYWVNDEFGIKYIYNGLLNLIIVDTLKGIGVFASVPLIILSTIAVYYETRSKND